MGSSEKQVDKCIPVFVKPGGCTSDEQRCILSCIWNLGSCQHGLTVEHIFGNYIFMNSFAAVRNIYLVVINCNLEFVIENWMFYIFLQKHDTTNDKCCEYILHWTEVSLNVLIMYRKLWYKI